MKIRQRLVFLLVIVLGVVSMTALSSRELQCPSVDAVFPFLNSVISVPFTQCAYLGQATQKNKVNYCTQIKSKLTMRFAQPLTHWSCQYDSNGQNTYFFTFRQLKN